MQTFDAVIIGGGIIGCCLARRLAGEGLRAVVIERGALGREASWAAAGMLSVAAEAEAGNPIFELGRASQSLYAELAAELKSETTIDPHYRTEGTLLLFETEEERQAELASLESQRARGIPFEELTGREVSAREPQLADFPGGFYLPQDYRIDNRRLMEALIQSCRRRGVEFLPGKEVRQVCRDGPRGLRVVLEKDQVYGARVVNAAGAWAGLVEATGAIRLVRAPIRPVKVHMLALQSCEAGLRHVIRGSQAYLVPREGGRIVVGSTMEEAGFDKTARAGPLARLISAAQQLCPVLESSTLAETWTGLRPAAPDGLPILGPTALDNYFVALGHFRNGILLAPITAEIMTEWMINGRPKIAVDDLSLERFRPGPCLPLS